MRFFNYPFKFLMLVMMVVASIVAGGLVMSQPPGGPPPFELGRLLPPGLRQQLDLTPEQLKGIEELEAEAKGRLEKILTKEQQKMAVSPGPRGRFDRGNPFIPVLAEKPGPIVEVPESLAVVSEGGAPKLELTGDAFEGALGEPGKEGGYRGIRLPSGNDKNSDGTRSGSATFTVNGLKPQAGRWYSLRVRLLVQDGFKVNGENQPRFTVAFSKDKGSNSLDSVSKSFGESINRDRVSLADAGTNKNLGQSSWRWYGFDFRTPFPEVDTLRITAGYEGGVGIGTDSEIWISEVKLTSIPGPEQTPDSKAPPVPAAESLVRIAGRWHYDSTGVSKDIPQRFDHKNAHRLVYISDKPETPFAGNMSSWLRRGYLDRQGNPVEKDLFVPDAVTLSIEGAHLVMRSRNLPNHPTGVFPDRARWLDGNPNVIRDQSFTWRLPLEPRENPSHRAMDAKNSNRALPMGPIGVAVNGVVFYNPFDHIAEADAVWRLDRCCGHPSPMQEYHYHKYPVCVNTPWVDDGGGHSPLIGFAFDGFPVYGPYESAGRLAKDDKDHPLNAFNLHEDPARGPHYHVTPGRFPHIIGGYWGILEPQRRGGR